MSAVTPDFIQIPKPVLVADIPASHKILFGYIYWYTKLALQTCTASNETLGKLAGLKSDSVSDAVKALKDKGFISVRYDGSPRSKNTKRTIDSLVSYENHVPIKNGTRKQGYVPIKNGTGAGENPNKEEYIKRNKKDLVNEKSGKTVDNADDHRGVPSPAKERLREMFQNRKHEQVSLIGG